MKRVSLKWRRTLGAINGFASSWICLQVERREVWWVPEMPKPRETVIEEKKSL